jgi:hypothetical protein
MTQTTVSRRHRILIAAAVAAVLGPRARVHEITHGKWSQLRPGHQPAPRHSFRRPVQAYVRTARREKAHEAANLA